MPKPTTRYVRFMCPKCKAKIRAARSATPPICSDCTNWHYGYEGRVVFELSPTPGDAK